MSELFKFFGAFKKAAILFILINIFFQILFPLLGTIPYIRSVLITGTGKYTEYMLSGVSEKLDKAKIQDTKEKTSPFFSRQTRIFFFHNLSVMLLLFIGPHALIFFEYIKPSSNKKKKHGNLITFLTKPITFFVSLLFKTANLFWWISGIRINENIMFETKSLKDEYEYTFSFFPILLFTLSTTILAVILSYLKMISIEQVGWFNYINMINLMLWHGVFELTALIMIPAFYIYTWDKVSLKIDSEKPGMTDRKSIKEGYTGYIKILENHKLFIVIFLILIVHFVYFAAVIEAHWTEKLATRALLKLDKHTSISGLSYLLHTHYKYEDNLKSFEHYKNYLKLKYNNPNDTNYVNKAYSLHLPEICLKYLNKITKKSYKKNKERFNQIKMSCLIDLKRDQEALSIAYDNKWTNLAKGLIAVREKKQNSVKEHFSKVTEKQCHAINFKWIQKRISDKS
ncbi:hypothetical protein KAJ27_23960 [bacterium]|nr:hypothetical protein [bacterium]